MQAEDDEVSSEVSVALVSAAAGATEHGQRRQAACFNFFFKRGTACDADGDLEPPRRRHAKRRRGRVSPPANGCEEHEDTNAGAVLTVSLQLQTTSTVALCGMQVWGAALLLVDLIISRMHCFHNHVAVELGAGAGLPGLVLAKVCRRVFLTDFADDVLRQCQQNVSLNSSACCLVRRLDWTHALEEDSDQFTPGDESDEFSWRSTDLADVRRCSYFLAADVIYSNEITEAFIAQAKRLLLAESCPAERQIFVAVDQRYNFTLPECTTTSREYDHFVDLLVGLTAYKQERKADGYIGDVRRIKCEEMRVDESMEQHSAYDRAHMRLWRLSLAA